MFPLHNIIKGYWGVKVLLRVSGEEFVCLEGVLVMGKANARVGGDDGSLGLQGCEDVVRQAVAAIPTDVEIALVVLAKGVIGAEVMFYGKSINRALGFVEGSHGIYGRFIF